GRGGGGWAGARPRGSCSTSASRWPPARWTTTAGSERSGTISPGSTPSCASASSGCRPVRTSWPTKEVPRERAARGNCRNRGTGFGNPGEGSWRPEDPRGHGRLGQDGEDDRGRARGPGQAPAVLEGHPPDHEGEG